MRKVTKREMIQQLLKSLVEPETNTVGEYQLYFDDEQLNSIITRISNILEINIDDSVEIERREGN